MREGMDDSPGERMKVIQVYQMKYVVEYDLPVDSRRLRFYRGIKRYLRDHFMEETGWSTQSVVFTENVDFAKYVFMMARKVGGTSHIYEARRIDDEP